MRNLSIYLLEDNIKKNYGSCNNFGIDNKNVDNNTDLTLQEIGDLFNITRMRVCQIEKQTLLKMKKQLENLLT